MRQRLDSPELEDATLATATKGKRLYKTFTAAEQLGDDIPPILIHAGASAVTIRLPDSTVAKNVGKILYIASDQAATTVVTLNFFGGGAFTPAIATPAGGAVSVICTGLTGALGWKAV